MEAVNFGIIGCGVIGRMHARMAVDSPQVNVVAVADVRRAAAQAVAADFKIERVYTKAAELLADPQVEAVVLALPAHARTGLALQAFAQGKHVLTEKPVAMNAAEVRQLLAAQGDLVAGCCSSRFHFLDATRAVTDFIASGALGALRVVRCRAIKPAGPPPQSPPPPWRLNKALNAGGIMANWGCYDLDYLLGITGWTLKPQRVLAQTWTVPAPFAGHVAPDSDAETHLTALIRCAGGITITYERGEYVAAEEENSWQVIGENGSLRLQMIPGPDKTIIFNAADDEKGAVSQVIWAGQDDYQATHAGPMRDFAEAIRLGRPPQTDLERALLIQQITDAIYASAERGEAVQIASTS